MDDPARLSLILAGVQKAGTSSLFGYLADHPALVAPSRKELHFFDDERIDWSAPDYGQIDAAFPPADGRLRFEATPIYLFWPQALERIQRYNPDIRLILVFRDPIDRAWSHWRMELTRGDEHRAFSDAIRAVPIGEFGLRHHSYVARGLYGAQVQHALTLFERDQVLMLTAEELWHERLDVLARVADFVGISGFEAPAARRDNAGKPMGDVPATDADYLRSTYAEDMVLFAGLSGLATGGWRVNALPPGAGAGR